MKKYWTFVNKIENKELKFSNIEILIRKNEMKEKLMIFFDEIDLDFSLILIDSNSWKIIYENKIIPSSEHNPFISLKWAENDWFFLIEDTDRNIYRININSFDIKNKDFKEKIYLFNLKFLEVSTYYIRNYRKTLWWKVNHFFFVYNYIKKDSEFFSTDREKYCCFFSKKWIYVLNEKDSIVHDIWNKILEKLWLKRNTDFMILKSKEIEEYFLIEKFRTERLKENSNRLEWYNIVFDKDMNLIECWKINHEIIEKYKPIWELVKLWWKSINNNIINNNFKKSVLYKEWKYVQTLTYYYNWVIYFEEYDLVDINLKKCLSRIELNIDSKEFFEFFIKRHSDLINWTLVLDKRKLTERDKHFLSIELEILKEIYKNWLLKKLNNTSLEPLYISNFNESYINTTNWNLEIRFAVIEYLEWKYDFEMKEIIFMISLDIQNFEKNILKTDETYWTELPLTFKNWDFWIKLIKTDFK